MCLISKWRFPNKASKDIKCYKVLSKTFGEYYPPFFDEEPIDITIPFKAKGNSLSIINNKEKGKGYIHVFSNIDSAKCFAHEELVDSTIFECIIPKGTKYHMSKEGDQFCSKVIIFNKQIPSYEIYNIH